MSKEAMKQALEALELSSVTVDNFSVQKKTQEAIAAIREALAKQPAQQEPVALKWQRAPIKTQWGDEMVVASVAIDKDHTVCLYCERDQALKVEAMFAQRTWVGLTDEAIWLEYQRFWPFHPAEEPTLAKDIAKFARAIEAAHGIKENT